MPRPPPLPAAPSAAAAAGPGRRRRRRGLGLRGGGGAAEGAGAEGAGATAAAAAAAEEGEGGTAALKRLQREAFRELADLRDGAAAAAARLGAAEAALAAARARPELSGTVALGLLPAEPEADAGAVLDGLGFAGRLEQATLDGRGTASLRFSAPLGPAAGRGPAGAAGVEQVMLEARPRPWATVRACPFGATVGDAGPQLNPQPGLAPFAQGPAVRAEAKGGMLMAQAEADDFVLSAAAFSSRAPARRGLGGLSGFLQGIYRLPGGKAAVAAHVLTGEGGLRAAGPAPARLGAAAVAQVGEDVLVAAWAAAAPGEALHEWAVKATAIDDGGLGWGLALGRPAGAGKGCHQGEAFFRLPVADNLALLPGVVYHSADGADSNTLAVKAEWAL